MKKYIGILVFILLFGMISSSSHAYIFIKRLLFDAVSEEAPPVGTNRYVTTDGDHYVTTDGDYYITTDQQIE